MSLNQQSYDPPAPVTVLGGGIMGLGIAQVFAAAGCPVRLYDTSPQALEKAAGAIAQSLKLFVEAGLMDEARALASGARVDTCENLEQACQGARVVFEAAPEKLAIKHALFQRVEELVDPEVMLCSNTSGLPIGDIASALKHPERFLGTHFWNPAQVLPCVEVIAGPLTSPQITEAAAAMLEKAGKSPVRLKADLPGFIGNRLQHALQREALYLVEEGVAEPEDVDKVVKGGFGLRYCLMGPLERADLGGLDTTLAVQEYLLPDLDTRTTASPLLAQRVAAGDLGLKTGQGLFSWDPEKARQATGRRDRTLLQIIKLLA